MDYFQRSCIKQILRSPMFKWKPEIKFFMTFREHFNEVRCDKSLGKKKVSLYETLSRIQKRRKHTKHK